MSKSCIKYSARSHVMIQSAGYTETEVISVMSIKCIYVLTHYVYRYMYKKVYCHQNIYVYAAIQEMMVGNI